MESMILLGCVLFAGFLALVFGLLYLDECVRVRELRSDIDYWQRMFRQRDEACDALIQGRAIASKPAAKSVVN